MYHYIHTLEPDIIIKTTELVSDDVSSFEGVIVRISDEHEEEIGFGVDEVSDGWVPAYFRLMTDEDLKNEGVTREYLYQELSNGGYIIVREMKYYKDGKKFDGILDYFSTDNFEDMTIGDFISGKTSDYKKIDGMERDSLILLERENLEMFDNWLTPSNDLTPTYDKLEIPESKENFTVVYNRIDGSYPSITYETKFIHMVCMETQIKEELEKIVNKDDRVVIHIDFIFKGHILPIN